MATDTESWTLNYLPEDGPRVLGTLTVGPGEVTFETGEAADDIVLPREAIAGAEAARKLLMNRVVIATTDGRKYTFEYGLLSVRGILDAINARD